MKALLGSKEDRCVMLVNLASFVFVEGHVPRLFDRLKNQSVSTNVLDHLLQLQSDGRRVHLEHNTQLSPFMYHTYTRFLLC